MAYEIMGEYDIGGEAIEDVLGQFDDDDYDILGYDGELVIGQDEDDEEIYDLLGATDPALIGAMSQRQYRALLRRKKAAAAARVRASRAGLLPGQRRPRPRPRGLPSGAIVRGGYSPAAAAAASIMAKNAAMVTDKVPTKSREYPMGFDSVATVAAGANVQIISRPQVPFRPERLVVSGGIAASFLINDIKVGKNSQLVNSSALPGDAFSPTAFGVRLMMDTAQISQDVVLDITNISAGALRFNAALFGKAIE